MLLDASFGRVLQDDTKPTGSVTIEGGRASTRDRTVRLTLEATDPGPNSSGVSRMHIKNAGGAWTKWSPYEPKKTWIKIHMPTSRLGNDEVQGKSEGVVTYDDFRFLRKGAAVFEGRGQLRDPVACSKNGLSPGASLTANPHRFHERPCPAPIVSY